MTLSSCPTNMVPALAGLAREVAAEGAVLLKNDHQLLPLRNGQTVSVFGRCQYDYYKSGTGSGGMVNAPYVVSILEGLRHNPKVCLNEELATVYTAWCRDNPPKQSEAWASDPWSQPEMPLTDTLIEQAAAFSDTALVVIGRTAGEDRDAANTEGSFLLSADEREMLRMVTSRIPHVAVLLNVGNILDMSWEDDYPIDAIVYVWHGGMEGGNAVADVLTGRVPVCGKLSDTIAISYADYPSATHFGGDSEVLYTEDIYVGYRYFETFAPDRVRYPFGFGLSYTNFSTDAHAMVEDDTITVTATVTNTGDREGKEVVQVYASAPQGVLGKPARQLMGFAKTALLAPGDRQTITIRFAVDQMASYDDSGKTGHRSAYVLEAGDYSVYVGACVQTAVPVLVVRQHVLRVVRVCEEALAPAHPFDRLTAAETGGQIVPTYESVPLRQTDEAARIADRLPAPLSPADGDAPTFAQVCRGEASPEAFVARLPLSDLAYLCRAEGMNSPKVTPGTASAFGGLTPSLMAIGLPVACCADGPSGIRMDNGAPATSLPIGTLMACTWNPPLIERLHRLEGQELLLNRVDCWLSPGMNIHRNPLCGRNFEYFSEDPLLTGVMAAAVVRGVQATGVGATPKHFAANNQEHRRHDADSCVSERALREIYLKGFEIVVKTARPAAIMTSYNLINGRHAANAYDLTTTILRGEWGFTGMVMTDWWAKKEADGLLREEAAMIRAQNDIAMPVGSDAFIVKAVQGDALTLGEVQRCAVNIVRLLVRAPVSRNYVPGDGYRPGPDWFSVTL